MKNELKFNSIFEGQINSPHMYQVQPAKPLYPPPKKKKKNRKKETKNIGPN